MKYILKKTIISISFIFLLALLIMCIYTLTYIKKTILELDEIDFNQFKKDESILIYDNDNNLIMDLGLKKTEYVSIDEISSNMINALLSIEDKRFYEHNGIDYKRLAKAMLINIKEKSFKQGASTINQQLIKNIFLTSDKNIKRKVQEMYLSFNLESYLTKDQILEYYLNNVLFGKCFYGIGRASIYYFNKNPIDLEIDEAALLAGIVQLPNFYNPYYNMEDAIIRRNIVLLSMKNNGHLSENDFLFYSNKPIKLNPNIDKLFENFGINPIYNSYYDLIIDEIINNYQIDMYNNNLKIYTNLDIMLQNTLYSIFQNKYNNFKNEDMQAGITVINNQNNSISAILGSRSDNQGVINYALEKHQPASTIKPLLIYSNVFEYLKYSPAHLINDEKIKYSNNEDINNWDNLYKGYISIRKSLVESRNIPALKLYQLLNKSKIYQFLKDIGLNTDDPYLEAHALGGFTTGFNTLEMANAYSIFSNQGYYKKALAIKYININGKSIFYNTDYKKVLSDSSVFLINDILKDILRNTIYSPNGMNMKIKTGQTNFSNNIIKNMVFLNILLKIVGLLDIMIIILSLYGLDLID